MKLTYPIRLLLGAVRNEADVASGKWAVATKRERREAKKKVEELKIAIDKLKSK